MFITPWVVGTVVNGLPALSGQLGQFLLKDLVLIGVALWPLGESLETARAKHRRGAVRSGATPDRASHTQPSALDPYLAALWPSYLAYGVTFMLIVSQH